MKTIGLGSTEIAGKAKNSGVKLNAQLMTKADAKQNTGVKAADAKDKAQK